MHYDHLVETIVSELYKKLSAQPTIEQNILVIGNSGSEMSKQNLGLIPFTEMTTIEQEYSSIVVSELSCTMLAHLALGIGDTAEEKYILTSLLKGRTVYLLERGIEYRYYKHDAYRNVYNMYLAYEEQLKKFGIKFIDDIRDIMVNDRKINDATFKPYLTKEKHSLKNNKKLILESDVKHAYRQGVDILELRKDSIITPLAEDFIKSHHISITRI